MADKWASLKHAIVSLCDEIAGWNAVGPETHPSTDEQLLLSIALEQTTVAHWVSVKLGSLSDITLR